MANFHLPDHKRKRGPDSISYNDEETHTFVFENPFAYKSSPSLDNGDDPKDKKPKAIDGYLTPSPPSKPAGRINSPALHSTDSPSSALSSQDSMTPTSSNHVVKKSLPLPNKLDLSASGLATTPLTVALRTTDTVQENSNSERDQDFMDLVIARGRRLFHRPTTSELLQDLRARLQPILHNRLSQLTRMEPTFEVGLEISDSAYILKLLKGHDSNFEFETITQKAVRGAALLQQGVKLVREVQDQLKFAIND
ncbi:unnamed protein product [Ilex paraguariensis]|uniref:Uncharacterized protein n=1 Tax=Ilex paraguariensis TaxID=185542 RepID=A0ABC8SI55_9AQUA